MKRFWMVCLFYLCLFLVWALLARLKVWPEYIFPPPWEVGEKLARGLANKTFMIGAVTSLRRIFIGYAFSAAVGITVGMFLGRSAILDETLGSLVSALHTIPSICWLPLAILWFGLSENTIIFVVIMGAVFSIIIAARGGVRNIPPIYVRAGKNMGARGFQLFTEIMAPASFPAIVAGLRQGWSFAWRALMAAELIMVNLGLGHLLMMGRELNDLAQVIAVMLVLMLIGLVVEKLIFLRLDKSIGERWGLSGRQ
ncbi:MAG: ABC transporter permease [Bacillota bacterium]